ncbi:MAG: PilZ domain-containing protein [Desulfobacteraceae bacterium]|nr:PilZ domain-containing protein [Desulfobacteraceae bacterium]MBC2756519.1 PilZ domain-containing protein [Desulfobacteraceae bacterium]
MDYIEKIIDNDAPDGVVDTSEASLRIIDTDLEVLQKPKKLQTDKTVKRKFLVNQLNNINFKDETVCINFQHIHEKQVISFYGSPQPCFGKRLVCLWKDLPNINKLITTYQFLNFVIKDARSIITVDAELRCINHRGACFTLPEKSSQTSARKAKRFPCNNLDVQLIQNSIIFSGKLVEFSSISLQVEIEYSPKKPFQWINLKDKVNLIVSNDQETLYSGECTILKASGTSKKRKAVFQPIHETIQRFNPRVYRSIRLAITPSPDIQFNHPFTNKLVNFKVIDLSGSGVSVEDEEKSSVLLPGMIIPAMTLNFANSFNFPCKAQVVYRKAFETDNSLRMIKCGIVFLDMKSEDHIRLLSLLHLTNNKNFYICNDIDMEKLWDFFFKSGFIYPKKYSFIHENKKKIKTTYEKLYTRESNIARHFIWQKKGEILGHMSMLRFYHNTWLIQHLAAIMSKYQLKVGIEILNQIGAYAYDSHRLFSSHMDYLICYFRPENHFPNHFFGGVAKNIQDPKACSVDTFAYFHYRKSTRINPELPENWNLDKSEFSDLEDLEYFYEHQSGGLMLDALDLIPDSEMTDRHDLSSEYAKIKLKRERRLYSLKHDYTLKAVVMLNISDFAVNMSDLTNCINVFVIDPENLSPEIILSAVSTLSEKYKEKKFPVLLFPADYADTHSLKYEKSYNLWALNMLHTDDYFKNFNYLI